MNKWGGEGGGRIGEGVRGGGGGSEWSNFPSRVTVLYVLPERLHFSLTKLTQILYDMDYFVFFFI